MKKIRMYPRLAPTMLALLAVLLMACAPAASPSPTAKPAAPAPTQAAAAPAPKPAESPAAKPAESPAAKPAESPAARPAAAAKPGELPKLRVAMGPLDFTKMNYLKWAEDMRAQGVADIELVPFENSAQMGQATVSGATQIMLNAVASTIQLAQQGGPEMVYIATALQSPDYILVSRNTVDSMAAMEGKKLGISTPGDISDSLARAAFKRSNVDAEKVQFVRVGGSAARMTAVQQGSIDAGMSHVAEGLIAISKAPELKNLFSIGTIVPDYIQFGMSAKREWITGNKDLTQKLIDGFIEANRWAARSKQEYIAMARKELRGFSDVEEKILSDSYDLFTQVKMFAVNGGLQPALIDGTLALDQEAGTIKDALPERSKWLDTSFVDDYLKRKGSQ